MTHGFPGENNMSFLEDLSKDLKIIFGSSPRDAAFDARTKATSDELFKTDIDAGSMSFDDLLRILGGKSSSAETMGAVEAALPGVSSSDPLVDPTELQSIIRPPSGPEMPSVPVMPVESEALGRMASTFGDDERAALDKKLKAFQDKEKFERMLKGLLSGRTSKTPSVFGDDDRGALMRQLDFLNPRPKR
jgi:hypothetical protein